MANLKVTILHDVWEEGPPEPEPEPVKPPRGKNGKRPNEKEGPAARSRRDLRSADQARARAFLLRSRRQESVAACAGQDAAPISSSISPSPMPATTRWTRTSRRISNCCTFPTPAAARTRSISRRTRRLRKRSSTFTRSRRPTSRLRTKAAPITRTTSSSR